MSTNLVEVKHSLTKKLIINFLIICTLAGTILTALTYYRTKNYIWSLFSRITTSCAVSVSHMFNDMNAPFYDYINHKQMALYNNHLRILKDFAKSFNLKYLYVYIPDIKNDKIIYYKSENNLPLGIIDGFEYQKTEEKLNQGDMMFLYTDGVTEAMDVSENLYGEENLKNIMNKNKDLDIQEVITEVENDVKRYSQNTEQSDDITTLIFRYNGNV